MSDLAGIIEAFAGYELYARDLPAVTIKSRVYLDALELLREQSKKIKSLEQTIEDICCGGAVK